MLHSERLLKLHHVGINIELPFDRCVDQLIIKYQKLLAEKEARDKGEFEAYLHQIKTIARN